MFSTTTIQHLARKEIDIKKWDDCINKASNELIYAYSYYLDALCTNWDALVVNDYEMVMPLPWRRKWGFYYLYQPFFIPLLGVFGNDLSPSIIKACLENIPKKFSYWDIDMNEKNEVSTSEKIKVRHRTNLFLSLDQPYQIQSKNYKRLAKRKIQSALENGLTIQRNVSPEIIIQSYEKHYEDKQRIIPHEMYDQLVQVINTLPKKNYQTYLVKKQEEIFAFYLVLVDKQNVYSLLGGSTDEGKEHGAFYLATDAAIQDYSNSKKTFRFEGSDIEGIAFFDLQFGSFSVTYPHLQMNNLPWPLRYLK